MESKESFQKFRDDNFLAYHTLNDKLVLEYFYLSQFYDPSSLNQRRRRGLQVSSTAEGIEFRLLFRNSTARGLIQAAPGSQWNYPNQFGIFVIQKFNRDSKGTETPLECYYVIGGTIFKSPSLGDLIRHRLLGSIKHLDLALTSLSDISSWSLIEGYSWGIPGEDNEDEFLPAQKQPKEEGFEMRELAMEEEMEDVKTEGASTQLSDGSETPSQFLKRRARRDSNFEFASRWVAMKDLYTKRPCTDASRVIEDTFSALATASLRFNASVDDIRGGWQKSDVTWRDEQMCALEKNRVDMNSDVEQIGKTNS